MKIILLIFLFAFTTGNVLAQKQTYFLFAHAKKRTVQICGEKVLIKSAEVSLTAEEATNYKQKYLEQLKATYNSTNGYESVNVELGRPGQVVIIYEGEKTYDQRRDGWNCTSTFYGCQIGSDVLTAEKKFAALQNEFKTSVFKEIKRWGSRAMQSNSEDDLEIRWVKTGKNIKVFFKNRKKDEALEVFIKSYKQPASGSVDLKAKGAFEKLTKTGNRSVIVAAGASVQMLLDDADAFEIDALPPEKEGGLINQTKHLIRQYITKPDKIEGISNVGVRG